MLAGVRQECKSFSAGLFFFLFLETVFLSFFLCNIKTNEKQQPRASLSLNNSVLFFVLIFSFCKCWHCKSLVLFKSFLDESCDVQFQISSEKQCKKMNLNAIWMLI